MTLIKPTLPPILGPTLDALSPGGSLPWERRGGAAPAAAWLPSDITGVAEWWRADLGVTDAGGGAVSAWQGQIAGETVTQGTAAARPTLTTQDGQSVLSFDGGDFLRGAFGTLGAVASPYTWIFVVEQTAGVYLLGGDDLSNRCQVYVSAGAWRTWSGVALPSGVSPGGEQALVAVYGDAAGKTYVDDLTSPAASGTTGTASCDGVTFGATSTGASNLTGYLWEAILVGQEITAGDLALLGAYLDARYAGLSLTY